MPLVFRLPVFVIGILSNWVSTQRNQAFKNDECILPVIRPAYEGLKLSFPNAESQLNFAMHPT
jgi:hypothetical protein